MPRRVSALGARIEADCGLDALVAEQQPNDLVLAGIAIKKKLSDRMAEAVCRQIESGVRVYQFLDLTATPV
jgi:hypothetical protein